MDTSFASVLVLHTLPVRLVFIHSISLISVVVIDQDFMPLSRNSYFSHYQKKILLLLLTETTGTLRRVVTYIQNRLDVVGGGG